MSELTKRVLFGVPAAILFLAIMWLGGIYFEILIGLIAAGTMWEIHRLTQHAGAPDYFVLSGLIAVLIWFSARIPVTALYVGAGCLIGVSLWSFFSSNKDRSKRWFSTLFCGIYAPLGFLLLVEIRSMGLTVEGFWLTVAVVLMIWGNDIFAYFGGKSFGKNPLAPNISPNKTWEGFFSGFFGAAVGVMIAYLLAEPFPVTLLLLIPAVIIASIFGPLGDLLESRLKRIAGVKDSSSILPGHGGLFDRFDALVLTAPVLYIYFSIVV